MFYIITYATHSENYFELLKTYPNLIILGFGNKWNGFKDKADAVVSFCKKIQSDDIVCCVDGFDTIILESSYEILKRFKELNKNLIFSKDCNLTSSINKYFNDKVFGKCNNERICAGLYIGKASAIINVWKGLKENMDDQRFITKKCISGFDIYIDTTNYIFYNYSPIDKIKIKNKKLYVNNNSFNTCILGAPGNASIESILKKLDYKNTNLIKKNKRRLYYDLKTHLVKFIPEIILFIVLIFIFIFFGFNRLSTYFIAILLIVVFLEIVIKTTFLNISNSKKVIYTIVDIIHNILVLFVIYSLIVLIIDIFKLKCNIKLFLFFNLYILLFLVLFFIFKRCILSIYSSYLLKNKNKKENNLSDLTEWTLPQNRIKYLFSNKTQYISIYKKNDIHNNNTFLWIDGGNKQLLSLLIIIIIYFIIMIYFNKCKY